MQDLASLGLKVRICAPSTPDEQRLELRLISSDAFVAWFQSNLRISDGDRIVATTTQLVHRSELSNEQLVSARQWLHEQWVALL